jgi:hypothetical protein
VVTVLLAITVLPVELFSVFDGDHTYVDAPLAVKLTLLNWHTLAVGTVIIGFGAAITENVALFVQVAALPITVPVPIGLLGIAVTMIGEPEFVLAFMPVNPVQL